MSEPKDALSRQTRKRLATRQSISDAATRLFFERGFDAVTVDQIAEAADVSRMTVFNHFARKEDMFFDLEEEVRDAMLAALEQRADSVSPVEALHHFVRGAVLEETLYGSIFAPVSSRFVATVRASERLMARVREIRDELSDDLARGLARAVHRPESEPAAALAASLLVTTWAVALLQAHDAHRQGSASPDEAKQGFHEMTERGLQGVRSALAGTPYV